MIRLIKKLRKKNKKKEKKTEEARKICIHTEAIFLDEYLTGRRRTSETTRKMKETQQIQSQQQSPQEVSPDIV